MYKATSAQVLTDRAHGGTTNCSEHCGTNRVQAFSVQLGCLRNILVSNSLTELSTTHRASKFH